jgi:steroid delta-isomerase
MELHEKIRAAVHGYVAGFEAADADAIVALFAADASVEDPVGTPVVHGLDAIRAFYTRSLKLKPKLKLQEPIRVVENSAAFAFAAAVSAPSGNIEIDVIDVMTFNDAGKITSMRAFFGPTNIRKV